MARRIKPGSRYNVTAPSRDGQRSFGDNTFAVGNVRVATTDTAASITGDVSIWRNNPSDPDNPILIDVFHPYSGTRDDYPGMDVREVPLVNGREALRGKIDSYVRSGTREVNAFMRALGYDPNPGRRR